jgi:diguanylate cyclase (GGDEF)-like protein
MSADRAGDVVDFLTQRVIGRLAGVLFVVGALAQLPIVLLPGHAAGRAGILAVIGAAAVTGLLCFVLPWQRWPRRATLVMAPLAFVLIAAGNVIQTDPWTYSVYFILVFVWVGVGQPQGMSMRLLPLAFGAYLVPAAWDKLPQPAYDSLLVVMPVCLLVGESLSWVSAKLRRAELQDARRMQAMQRLVEASVGLARQSDPHHASDLVAQLATSMLGGRSAVVLLMDDDGSVHGMGSFAWPGPVDSISARWLDTAARTALETGELVTYRGGASEAGHLAVVARGAPVTFLPLIGSSEPVGLVMVVFEHDDPMKIDAFTRQLARTFATQATLAFERLEATEVLLDASLKDQLTQIGNRRAADQSLKRVRDGDAVVLIDLDHFKDVNDRLGHAAGDEALASLAAFLQRFLRDGDTVARYGGEEFLVILRAVAQGAKVAVERIASEWRLLDPVATFSAGVAVQSGGVPGTVTLARADEALYAAKRAGRDRVMLAGEAAEEVISVP